MAFSRAHTSVKVTDVEKLLMQTPGMTYFPTQSMAVASAKRNRHSTLTLIIR